MAKNGYFQLDIADDGTYLIVYPPEGEGKACDTMEIVNYLDKNKISGFDLADLAKFVGGVADEKGRYKLCNSRAFECPESIKVVLSRDRMTAIAKVYAPSTKGKQMTYDDFISDLKFNKVISGLAETNIRSFIEKRIYNTEFIVAKGKPVRVGSDAKVTYHFNVCNTNKPKLLEDGSVDFHELNIFTRVEKGALLATLTPEDPGEKGMDVSGNTVLPPKVAKRILKFGRNITLSEDKLRIYSEVDGDVKLEGDTVFVSDTYRVAADVDASTGDIDYNGNVIIAGNVRTGFKVKAKGSVEVDGVVEGATIIAGDSIILKRGLQGKSKGYLEAGNDVVANFIESGTVVAGNNVNAGYLLHSDVKAKNEVIVSGRKGFIIGGKTEAGNSISVESVSNDVEVPTSLRVGAPSEMYDRLDTLKKEKADLEEQSEKYRKVFSMFQEQMKKGKKFTPDEVKKIQTIAPLLKQFSDQISEKSLEIDGINRFIEESVNAQIRVAGKVHVGTNIAINRASKFINKELYRAKFKVEGGEVVSVGY